MSPHFTLLDLEKLRSGDWLDTPRKYLRVHKFGKWYVLINELVRSKRFYVSAEDVFLVIYRESACG